MMITMMMQEVGAMGGFRGWMQEVDAGRGCRVWMQGVDAGCGCREWMQDVDAGCGCRGWMQGGWMQGVYRWIPPGWLRAWGTVGGKIAPEAPRGAPGEI